MFESEKTNYPELAQPCSFLLLKEQYTTFHYFQVKKYNCLLRGALQKGRNNAEYPEWVLG